MFFLRTMSLVIISVSAIAFMQSALPPGQAESVNDDLAVVLTENDKKPKPLPSDTVILADKKGPVTDKLMECRQAGRFITG